MKVDLVNNEEDTILEIVFGEDGSCVLFDKEDPAALVIDDSEGREMVVSVGDIDRLIEALTKVKEWRDD